jgi:ABC-2 type transport system permease protein
MSDDRSNPTLSDHMTLLNQHLALIGERLAPVDALMKEYFSWYVVAKKEFQDAIRSMGLWVLGLLFTGLFVLPPALVLYADVNLTGQAQQFGLLVLIEFVYKEMATIFVPIIAMFVGYGAITKERESGSLKILLSLPHSRRDVIIGKVLGRCAVVGVPLVVAFAITAVFLMLTQVSLKFDAYSLFTLYTVGLALVFVAIAVSISGAFSRTRLSLIGNFVVYIYFTFGWNAIANSLAKWLHNSLGISGSLRWHVVLVIKLLNPTQAYKTLTSSMLAEGSNAARQARMNMFTSGGLFGSGRPWDEAEICTQVLNGKAVLQRGIFTPTTINCEAAGASLPVYLTDPAVFVYLMLWIGVAAVISYETFNLADL